MMLEFLKKVFSKENTNDSSSPVDKEKDLKSVGVNNENDREYREKRMLQLETLDLSEEQLEKSKHIFDTWLISRWVDDDENVSFLPYPIWDEEAALVRKRYPTYQEALDHIKVVNGELSRLEELKDE